MQNSDYYSMNIEKTSKTFRFLYKRGILHDIQKHGQIGAIGFVFFLFRSILSRVLFAYSVRSYILEPLNKTRIRPKIWKFLGCDIGKHVHIGHNVIPDFGNPERIHIGDNVVISNGVTILCHKRDVTNYHKGDNAKHLPFKYEDVKIGNGCQIGLNCTILPGVTIGDGAIIGSCSLVTKDIPAWSIAIGSPAKVVKSLS
ncbi:MAG: acyltransferase [Paludibacteraceae bacterium]|nr:acyltransferase [Paludibacteraceae bacterium]